MKVNTLIGTLGSGFAACALLLGGCAGYGPGDLHVGQAQAAVEATLGPSTGRYTLPDGRTRLEFARGPLGRHTWMVDLDAAGHVAQWQQVLDERHFLAVLPGQTTEQVLQTLGRPGGRVAMWRDGQIWSWRYPNNDCLWYQVSFNAQGIATGGGYGSEPGCDPSDAARQ